MTRAAFLARAAAYVAALDGLGFLEPAGYVPDHPHFHHYVAVASQENALVLGWLAGTGVLRGRLLHEPAGAERAYQVVPASVRAYRAASAIGEGLRA